MTVILVDPRRPAVVPIEAVELLGGDVQFTEEMPIRVPWSLPSARPALIGAPRREGPDGGRRADHHRAGAAVG
jgi:XTP/dITP diphosphohydrolase